MKAFAALFGLLFAFTLVGTIVALAGALIYSIVASLRVRWVPVIYNVRSLTRRKVTTLFTVLGMSLVVFVFSTVLMLRDGIKRTLVSAGENDNVLVLRKGSTAEIVSVVDRNQAKLLGSRDDVATDPKDGKPLADPQLAILIYLHRVGAPEGQGANVFVRGLSDRTLSLHRNVRVLQGRWFTPGTSEVVIGRALVGKFDGAQLGGQVTFARRSWTVVGVIDAGGSAFESEIWADVEQAMEAFQRGLYSTMLLRLKPEAATAAHLESIQAEIGADPRLNLDVKREDRYYEDLSSGLSLFISFIGLFVAVVFSLGATLGSMISMYAQVAARTREIGTLRAIGFQRNAVLVSFVFESILLGLLAGVIGVGASTLMKFASFTTFNFNTFSEVTFRFALTPTVVTASMIFAAVMGYAGGLMPALRAARMPIVAATRG